jgi:hypothetical protein
VAIEDGGGFDFEIDWLPVVEAKLTGGVMTGAIDRAIGVESGDAMEAIATLSFGTIEVQPMSDAAQDGGLDIATWDFGAIEVQQQASLMVEAIEITSPI